MQALDQDELSIYIDAPPEAVYNLVADVTRTPEYSPEVSAAKWVNGARGPAAGARFRARNTIKKFSWHNTPIVTVAEPGREFAFARTEPFCGTVQWRYRFEPDAGGTQVTESYLVVRPITRLGWVLVSGFGADKDRRRTMHEGIKASLERLRTIAERGSSA
jgi:uncharacterized protein YndB with AHSA1/START domain